MNKNEKPSLWRGKGAAVGIVICFVAVIAMVGAYTFNNYQKQIDEQVAKAEQQALRREYVEAMKQSLKSQLDASVVIRPDGSSYRLTQKNK